MTRPVILFATLLLAAACGIAFGDLPIAPTDLLRALANPGDAPPQVSLVIWSIRLPRVLVAVLVGVALAVAGVIAQAVLRNPLADPGLIGINAGAALGAMIVLVALRGLPPVASPIAGFAGATLMALAIFALSWRQGTSSIRLLLVGIGLSAMAGGATTFLTAFGDIRDVQRAITWMAGSLYDASWDKVATLFIWVTPVSITVWLGAHHLDTIGLGDGPARTLGQRVQAARAVMMLGCTLLSGAAVAAVGLLGFVGLIAPHIGRRLVGPGHRLLVPMAALAGATLVVAADLLGRLVIAPAQLPVGLTIALVGAPFFAFLMWERRNA